MVLATIADGAKGIMDSPITLSAMLDGLLNVAVYITAIAVAFTWVAKALGWIKKPSHDRENAIEERFNTLETRMNVFAKNQDSMAMHYERLIGHYHSTAQHHDQAIKSMLEGLELLIEVEVASIDYKLNDGEDKTKLKEMDAKLNEFLTNNLYKSIKSETVDTGWDDIHPESLFERQEA